LQIELESTLWLAVADESFWWALSLALCITAAIMLWWGVEKRSLALARRMRPEALR
jgi:hypothetical protein